VEEDYSPPPFPDDRQVLGAFLPVQGMLFDRTVGSWKQMSWWPYDPCRSLRASDCLACPLNDCRLQERPTGAG
jgi:hypothetical protein